MSSKLSDIALPVREVMLTKLKTKLGEPVIVRCEAMREDITDAVIATLNLANAVGGLPGANPPALKKAKKPATAKESVDVVKKSLVYAGPVIEAGCWIEDENGRHVQAFCFCGEHPDRIPGRLLGMVDTMALFNAVMEAGGYLGGAVDAVRFPNEQGGGAAGAGVVRVGGDDGDAPGGPAGGPDPPRD